MTRVVLLALVVLVWSVSPVLKRVVMDHMSSLDDPPHLSPVRTFVVLNSFGCTVVAAVMAVSAQPMLYVKRLSLQAWTVLIVAVVLATLASCLLADLLRTGNPGTTMVFLNAGTNLCTYVVGALFYDKLTWEGMAGVLLIAAGVVLTQGVSKETTQTK